MRSRLLQRPAQQQRQRNLPLLSARMLGQGSLQLRAELAARCDENPALDFDEGLLPRPPAGGTDGPTLAEHLSGQLHQMPLAENARADALLCANLVDERGYLPPPPRLAQLTGLGRRRAATALRTIRSLDPVGVGARDLADCLLLQLDAAGGPVRVRRAARRILRDHFPEFGRRRHDLLPQELLPEALELIGGLQPRFANAFAPSAPAVEPELEVQRSIGVWRVSLRDGGLPIRLNEALVAGAGADRRMRRLVREARMLIDGARFRRDTLLTVAQAAVDRQRGFFERGPAALAPLRLRDVAAATGLAVSTVSTAIQHKYVASPGGVIALKYLFQRSTGNSMQTSAASLQEAIKRLVAGEDPGAPLTDSSIMRSLNHEGITTARRTIAKHRAAAGILPASLRRDREPARCR